MKYIATRPHVEKHGEHGLFGSSLHVDLDTAMRSLRQHEGYVWTFIFSLRREDAERLGYASAEKWQHLLSAHQTEFANALGIRQEDLRWYAAFHDADSHPHVHMMVWSDGPSQGYLTQEGVLSMRSKLTNEIFRDEMYSLYIQKDISYKELRSTVHAAMRDLIWQMEKSVCVSPVIEQKMSQLVAELNNATGKKQYGYLKKPVKEIVDSIVDELAKQPQVAQCYEEWNRLRDEIGSYYKDKPGEHLPLSQQKEFRVIKNMIVREAENIRQSVLTFEDDRKDIPEDKETALRWLELSAAQGNPYAQYLIDKANESYNSAILLSATRLLHHMSRIFQTNSVAPANPKGIRIDSRRRKLLQEKRIALGHKPDGHEDYVPTQTWEQTM